jgi:small subunit ribosomal protein S6e
VNFYGFKTQNPAKIQQTKFFKPPFSIIFMVFKINISYKGKTIKKEIENESLIGKKIGETLNGSEITPEFSGYEFEITGTSDSAGFAGKKDVEGPELKRVLLTKGFGMHKMPKREGKKKRATPEGLRLKKTVRGNTISTSTIQINLNVKKEGPTSFDSMVPKKEEAKKE